MSLPETCPFCGAADGLATKRLATFGCFTMIRENEIESRAFQSVACKDAERARLAARVAELEERCKRLEEAGDAIVDEYMVVEPEKSAWLQAKEAKP